MQTALIHSAVLAVAFGGSTFFIHTPSRQSFRRYRYTNNISQLNNKIKYFIKKIVKTSRFYVLYVLIKK